MKFKENPKKSDEKLEESLRDRVKRSPLEKILGKSKIPLDDLDAAYGSTCDYILQLEEF